MGVTTQMLADAAARRTPGRFRADPAWSERFAAPLLALAGPGARMRGAELDDLRDALLQRDELAHRLVCAVREEHVVPLEDAIRKMTSAVAVRLSLHDRGILAPGMFADVVVFDPATIADRATYEQPKQLSVGVRQVFVNGVQVIRDGTHTGAKPGRALRGPGFVRR